MSGSIEYYLKEIEGLRDCILNSALLQTNSEKYKIVKDFLDKINNIDFTKVNVYQMEADIICRLIQNNPLVHINTYDEKSNKLIVVAVAGLMKFIESLVKIGNVKLVGKEFPLDDKLAETLLQSGKIHRLPRGLKDAALGQIPDILVDIINELLGPFYVFENGILYRDKLVGNLGIFSRGYNIDQTTIDCLNNIIKVFAINDMIYRTLNIKPANILK